MGLDEARERAERELEALETATEVHEHDASPDAVLAAYAASANLAGMILFSEAVEHGTAALHQEVRRALQSLLHDIVPALRGALGER